MSPILVVPGFILAAVAHAVWRRWRLRRLAHTAIRPQFTVGRATVYGPADAPPARPTLALLRGGMSS